MLSDCRVEIFSTKICSIVPSSVIEYIFEEPTALTVEDTFGYLYSSINLVAIFVLQDWPVSGLPAVWPIIVVSDFWNHLCCFML